MADSSIDFGNLGPAVGARFPDMRLPDQGGRMLDFHADLGERDALVVFHRSARW